METDIKTAARWQRPILIVEDESFVAKAIEDELRANGYESVAVSTAEDGFEAARALDPMLIIADRMLAGVDSLSIIERLRRDDAHLPVLFVSGLTAVDERIRALKAGGDDYLTKPFALGELAARVDALLRRSQSAQDTALVVGPLMLDRISRMAQRGARAIALLPAEFKLLEYMMRHAGQTLSRAMLLEDVWGYRSLPNTNLIDVHIGKLRRKIDAAGETPLIHSVRGAGFTLQWRQ
ncbi:two component transcriptional regulator, winged helix family [Methylocella silvestris BL2]|uniref:Two component transcriptional regulator, winged helix family n=1 Tax=Methylocella silvestris (strain DSM 15510 / CIP 108128 / LMG 27833 / NCIMB 13906 / BL2) TaxID=395965 RepID=B8ES96_METSB|nr:response regulator transcription factor [Methylocella silvestris]ACK52311.1 two component transcriptional regulator, winged helix family [Methylocella silvestris BL2]